MNFAAIQGPDWLTRSAIYQINPRTFNAEGTIASVTKELPKLAEMGFGIMYLCPIFEEDDSTDQAFWSERQKGSQTNNPKNPYRIKNYFTIDEEYGTADDLRAFVDECHRLGMRVVLDLVYAHIAPNADILRTHPEFAQQDAQGNTICSIWHFPYLDFNCPGLREYLWCNMTYFISMFDIDGYRCDVGDQVPLDFWAEARRRIQAIKPDAALINEGRNPESLVRAFDSMYSFDWHETVYAVYTQDKPISAIRESWENTGKDLPAGYMVLRDIDNHDTSTDWPVRTEVAIGHQGMEQLQVMDYLMDGIPMVFCGNELGDTTTLSMFANRFFPGRFTATDRSIAAEDYSLRRQEVIRVLNNMKRDSDLLRYGKTVWLDGMPENIVAFRREWNGGTVTFIGNAKNEGCTVNMAAVGETLLSSGCVCTDNTIELEPYGYIALTTK